MKTYEGMFLLDTDSRDFDTVAQPVHEALARINAQVLSIKPWDERRLSYPIKGRKRGLYVLTYFKADPAEMAQLQHEIQLSETILRALLLSADHVSEEKMQAETPATLSRARRAAAEAQKAARAKAKAEEADKAGAEAEEPTKAKADPEPPAEGPPEQPPAEGTSGQASPTKPKPAPGEQTDETEAPLEKDPTKPDQETGGEA